MLTPGRGYVARALLLGRRRSGLSIGTVAGGTRSIAAAELNNPTNNDYGKDGER